MEYRSSFRRREKRRFGPILRSFGVAIACFLLFGYGIYHFRFAPKPTEEAPPIVATDVEVAGGLISIPGADGKDSEAELANVSGGGADGIATRVTDDDQYELRVNTSLLGDGIDRETYFYEVWLIRKVPYDFFSAGEMVTNSLGEFVLEWEGEKGKNYNGYTKVIVTLEARDENQAPAQHILEGEFGD
jgi:hypothetical protein